MISQYLKLVKSYVNHYIVTDEQMQAVTLFPFSEIRVANYAPDARKFTEKRKVLLLINSVAVSYKAIDLYKNPEKISDFYEVSGLVLNCYNMVAIYYGNNFPTTGYLSNVASFGLQLINVIADNILFAKVKDIIKLDTTIPCTFLALANTVNSIGDFGEYMLMVCGDQAEANDVPV